MAFTAAICTHNRPDAARDCIDSLAKQDNAGAFAILIVDSASPGRTSEALVQLSRRYGVGYLRVDEPGLSRARNAAVAAADTEWIAFLDDDAVPDADWAANLEMVVAELPPRTGAVGGLVRPGLATGELRCATDRCKLLLSCTTRAGSGPVSDGFNLCGANLAFERRHLLAIGGFGSALGRTGADLVSCEESHALERLIEIGMSPRYDDRFRVSHMIPPERDDVDWIARRAYWEGRSRIRMFRALGRKPPRSMNMFKLLASLPLLYAARWMSSDVDWRIRCDMARGALVEQLGW